MKKTLLSLLLCMLAVVGNAQNDVTKFLGIPVDGFYDDMRSKLIAKGFKPQKTTDSECFTGEFNGQKVNIFVATNNNKVCRIMVADANTLDEANIKVRFNTLVQQFKNNKKYIVIEDSTIPEDEDISYEMDIKKKIYESIAYQAGTFENAEDLMKVTTEQLAMKPVWFKIKKFSYDEYYITMFYDNEYNMANGEEL